MTPRARLARAAYEAWAATKASEVSWYNPFPWDELTEDTSFVSGAQTRWLVVADALLLALREPTAEQLEAGAIVWTDYLLVQMKKDPNETPLTDAYQAMIDVLLEGK